MRYFKKEDAIMAFDVDVIVENFGIDETWIELLGDDVLKLETQKPSEFHTKWDSKNKTWLDGRTPEQLAEYNRSQMPTLTPIEFDIRLVDAGLYDQVQDLIQSDVKLRIAYTRATFFSRTGPFIDQARIALNLTDEQVDEMWTS